MAASDTVLEVPYIRRFGEDSERTISSQGIAISIKIKMLILGQWRRFSVLPSRSDIF